MFPFALILILAGSVILVGISIWARQRQALGNRPELEHRLEAPDLEADTPEAVLVAREYGQLVYVNDHAKQWLDVRTGVPSLEYVARNAQPTDSFRGLFAGDRFATFQIGGRWVEGTSLQIPAEDEIRTVVTLREINGSGNGNRQDTNADTPSKRLDVSASMRIINEIGETVNASLSVEQVLQAILTIISKSVPLDAGEITLWDEKDGVLNQRGWLGNADYVVSLAMVGGAYEMGEGISGWVAKHREPLLISDVNAPDAVEPLLDDNPYSSFVAVPLSLGDRLLGTLELVHEEPGHFGQAHLALMQSIAKPVATAIYNAELYTAQIQRIEDIASLQNVTQERDAEDDVGAVYATMNERIANLIDVEVCGVLLYDEQRQRLVGQAPFHGLPGGLVQALSIPVNENAPAHEIWRRQDYWIANDPEDEPLLEASGISPVVMAAGLENLALIPMYVGQQRLGMIMVANKQALAGFTTPDIQNLRILVAQAAIVVQNVRLFEREQRQNTELAGLQEITHAIGALNNEDEVYVYSDINGRIANLMELQMCGILTYDDVDNKLVAQLPFHGVEDELIADYEIDLDKNEVMAELWEDEEYWYTNRAMADPLVYSADLAEMAERTGVEKTLIASLTVGGQKIGAVQVSNKLDGSDFTDNDARLLLIFATQAAAIIENARLVQEIQARAEEADRLRLIAERAGNLVTMDETLAPVLSEVARLTHSQLAFMSIVNDDTGALVTHPRAVFGAELDTALRVSPDSDTTEQLVTNTRRPLFANDIPDNPAYQSLVERLDIKRLLVVPLSIGDRSLGELGIANSETTYDDRDLEILQGVAAQLAATIDRIRLFEAAGENLNRRVQELDAISNVSHILNETIDLNAVLDAIRQEAARATDVDGATIAMLRTLDNWDEQREDDTPRLAFRVGEDKHIDGLADVERAAIDNDDAIIIEDYGRLDDMTPQPAGSTSAVALIFRYAAIPVGVIHLHDSHADRFDERAVSFLQTLASKASLGFGNAARYQEQMERSTILRQRVEQLNQIFELGQMLQTNTDQDMMLEAIAYSIVQSVGYDVVVITMADQEKGILRRETQAGLPVDAFERSKDDTLRLRELDALLKEELRISESYFYPIETIIEWEIAGLDALSAAHVGNRNIEAEGENVWQDGDMLLVPITGAGGELLGIISLDRPQNNQRPTRSQIEILEIFAHQAAATIENNRLYTSSLESAEQEARLNEMLEDIARTLDVDQIVESVAQNAFRLAPFSRMTVALKNQDEAGYTLHHAEFTTDSTLVTRKETQGDLMHTALGRTIQSGVDYVYTGQNDIDAYRDLTRWHNNGERVSLILPLAAGGEQLGAIHFGSDDERDFDPADFRTLLTRVGNLASVAIQNARLFDRAVNLQAFNESVLESIQQGIVVLDRSGRVISANQFMRDEYGWTEIDADDSRHDLFDYVPDLADPLSDELRTVLETGDPRSVLNLRTNTFGFMVRNFYIYPLVAEDAVSGAVLMIEDITERALLEENLESRANQLAALTRASGKITGTLQRDAVIDKTLDTMPEVVEHDAMTIWRRINPETMELVGAHGVDVDLDPPQRVSVEDEQRMSQIVETNTLMTIDDLPRFLETYQHALPGDDNAKSWLGVPLISQNYAVGMIVITSEQPNYFTPQSEQAALAFANQVAVSLTNAELFTETRARTERLSVLNRVSLALVQSMDSENIFEIALTEIANTVKAEKSRAILFDPEMETGRVLVDAPRGAETPTRQFNLRDRETYKYILDRMQALVYSQDNSKMPEPLSQEIQAEIEERELREYLLMPMMATGRIIGAFEFETHTKDLAVGADTLEIGQIIASQTAIAIQNANQLEEITTRTRELEMLLEAAQSTSLMMDIDEVFSTVVDLMLNTLDMQDCAVMIWDDVENVLEVQIDVNRDGDPDRVSPEGTRFDLTEYPARQEALRHKDVVILHAGDDNEDNAELAELEGQESALRMLVPLVVRDQSIGLIQVDSTDPHRSITEQERRLARALGAQVAVAIENARLSSETAAQINELFVINDLSRAISASLDVESVLEVVKEQVPSVTGASEMYIAFYDSDTEKITFPIAVADGEDMNMEPRQLGSDEVSFVIRNKRPLNLDNDYFSADDLRKSLGLTSGEGDVKSYLGVPLVAGDEVLGVLAVRDRERTRVFGLNDQRILTTVGSQLGATLQNARLFNQIQNHAAEKEEEVQQRTAELEEERDRLDMLYQITAELALTLDMDRVLSRALQMIASAVKAQDGVIMLVDPMTDSLYSRASLSYDDSDDDERASHPAESLASWLIHNDHELLVDDLHQQDYWDRQAPGAEEWRSAMAVLLETNEDMQGVLVLLSREVGAFGEPLLNLVIAAANQVASAINNADLYQLIREQAERLGSLLRTEQEEAEKNKAILEGIADGVMLIDNEGRISLFNSAAENMLGLARDDVMQHTLPELINSYGENVAAWADPIIRWTDEANQGETTPMPADRINVGNRVVSVNIAPVNVGPQYLGAVSVFRDVTRDVEVDNLKNEFIQRATHELRTPLTPIKGFASMMLMPNVDMPDFVREQVRTIKGNADRLAELVEDLLTVSKIDAGDSPMEIELVDLKTIVDVQLTNAQNRHYDKNIDVTVDVADDLPRASLDRGKAMQIVGNIIDNAFNYTLAGGNINIGLQADPEREKHILLTVEDSGVGIPEKFQNQVWERFARHEEHALDMDIPGTGLGLSIVRDLVHMHGGQVWFDSEEGVGTTFYVSLPIEYSRKTTHPQP